MRSHYEQRHGRCAVQRFAKDLDADDLAIWVAALAKARGESVTFRVNKDRTSIHAVVDTCKSRGK